MKKRYTVSKEFTFDAAHRLVMGYVGKCSSLHGHTWKVRVTYERNELNNFGMCVDFNNLKPVKDWIDRNLDHATIVSKTDSILVSFLQTHCQKMFIINHNPTSENIASFLYFKICELISPAPSEVKVWETSKCSAGFQCTSS